MTSVSIHKDEIHASKMGSLTIKIYNFHHKKYIYYNNINMLVQLTFGHNFVIN